MARAIPGARAPTGPPTRPPPRPRRSAAARRATSLERDPWRPATHTSPGTTCRCLPRDVRHTVACEDRERRRVLRQRRRWHGLTPLRATSPHRRRAGRVLFPRARAIATSRTVRRVAIASDVAAGLVGRGCRCRLRHPSAPRTRRLALAPRALHLSAGHASRVPGEASSRVPERCVPSRVTARR